MRPHEVPRPDLAQALIARARTGAPLLLTGPPGAGKTTLLTRVAGALAAEGCVPVYLDLMGAASSPERFVTAALAALPAGVFGRRLAQATQIRRLADSGRVHGAEAVQALFALWSVLDEAEGHPVVLLFDEPTEIRSLAYFAGLRDAHRHFGAALVRRHRGTLLATSFPTQAGQYWSFESLEARPLTPADLAPALLDRDEGAAFVRASFGWPRYLRVLLERRAASDDLLSAWAAEMAPGGRLELACRHTYESLLLRSRGYGMSKAVLSAVALEEGLNLTALVARLGRTPGAVRDYLQWLCGVDALRMSRKRYYYVDGLLRLWVRLHARGALASEEELLAVAREVVAPSTTAASAQVAAAPPEAAAREPVAPRRDTLMEID